MRRYFSASWLVLADYVLGQCPNSCSNKGQCDKFGVCHCLNGYGGGDCSLRTCPSDYAWTDYATADDVAHAKAECSNRGLCDRTSGRCECMVGFTGRACERMSCDFNCYNKGKCLSMRKIALTQYSDESEKFVYEAPWDADKVFGCVCDRPYDRFFNCAQRTCPSGDDPFTTGQVNEVQILKCMATGGSFALMYEGKSSGTIRARMTEEEVEKALTEAETIHAAKVTFTADNGTVCQSDSTNLVKIEFTQNFGSLPPLKPKADTLAGTVLVYADGLSQVGDADGTNHISIKGTKEDDQCSNRGLCDTFTATCACMTTNNDVYSSSDGYGNKGTRGDCGHAENSVTTCPGELPCSSNGVCDEETYRCSCKEGWYGADCSLRE